jgi:hypothetical protein
LKESNRNLSGGIFGNSLTPTRPKPWEGRCERRPWDWLVTAVIPHLETPELLPVIIRSLRLQHEAPRILIIDTGSRRSIEDDLEKLRDEDVDIHYLRNSGYKHRAMSVTVALDLGMQLAQTPWIYFTHTDCFPVRQNLLEDMRLRCNPVVGYEISPRDPVSSDWRGMVGHTCLMVYAPVIRKLGITWDIQRCIELPEYWNGVRNNPSEWPDTETGFNLLLRKHGIQPNIIGRELNVPRFRDGNIDHVRSYTSTRLYRSNDMIKKAVESIMTCARLECENRCSEWEAARRTYFTESE